MTSAGRLKNGSVNGTRLKSKAVIVSRLTKWGKGGKGR